MQSIALIFEQNFPCNNFIFLHGFNSIAPFSLFKVDKFYRFYKIFSTKPFYKFKIIQNSYLFWRQNSTSVKKETQLVYN